MTTPQIPALLAMLDQNVALFKRMRLMAERLHQQGPCSGALRSILRSLAQSGPQTVPMLARQHQMNRQPMQTFINQLHQQQLIGQQDNPAHKRSPLYALTESGQQLIAEMHQRELDLLQTLPLDIPVTELNQCCALLKRVQQLFDRLLASGRLPANPPSTATSAKPRRGHPPANAPCGLEPTRLSQTRR